MASLDANADVLRGADMTELEDFRAFLMVRLEYINDEITSRLASRNIRDEEYYQMRGRVLELHKILERLHGKINPPIDSIHPDCSQRSTSAHDASPQPQE